MKRVNHKRPVLYIKPGCPWCREALAFFAQHAIEIEVRDVQKEYQNLQRMVEVSGQSLTPTLEYGEFVVADFSLDELHDALKQVPEIKREFGLGAGEE